MSHLIKPYSFSQLESELIIEGLRLKNEAIELYRSTTDRINKEEQKKQATILACTEKVKSGGYNLYHSREIRLINSGIRWLLYDLKEVIKDDENRTAFEWLTKSENILDTEKRIDSCWDILVQTGYGKNNYVPEFRYRAIYDTFRKIHECNDVFLSHTDDKHIYKIAFMYNRCETIEFGLEFGINMYHLNFVQRSGVSLRTFGNYFGMQTDKKNAMKLLDDSPRKAAWEKGVFEFITYFLTNGTFAI